MTEARLRTVGFVIVVIVVGAVLAGCGVGTQDRAEVIDDDEVPFGLLRESAPGPTVGARTAATATLYFPTATGLGSVVRDVARLDAPTVLEAVVRGPTAREAGAGFRSALPPDLEASVRVRDGLAVVTLGRSFLDLSRSEQGYAVAQLVFSLTDLPEVNAVRFETGGGRLSVAVRGPEPTSDPIDRAQVLVPE